MKRKIKLLTETAEINPDGRSVRRLGESMDVQLDRWRLTHKEQTVILDYTVRTEHEPGSAGRPGALVTQAIITYMDAPDATRYGLSSAADPLEKRLYFDVLERLGRERLSGRTLTLGPSPLLGGLVHAQVDRVPTDGDEIDPNALGSEMYDLVLADRVLSRSADAPALIRGIRKALRKGGLCVVIEDGYAWHGHVAYTRMGLRRALSDFRVVYEGGRGNVLATAHKVLSYGLWAPDLSSVPFTEDPEASTYHWMAVTP